MGVLTLTRCDFSHLDQVRLFPPWPGATVRTLTMCDFGHSIGALSLVTQLRYVDKKNIVNIMEVYI